MIFELMTLMPLPPNSWDYRYEPPSSTKQPEKAFQKMLTLGWKPDIPASQARLPTSLVCASFSLAGFSALGKKMVNKVMVFFLLRSTFCRRHPLAVCATAALAPF